jgi:hypothetical protein
MIGMLVLFTGLSERKICSVCMICMVFPDHFRGYESLSPYERNS